MSKKRSKILIVDDDRSLSEILINILEYAGYETETAYNGKSAMTKIEANYFDLMLLDLKLPDASGMEILKKAMKNKSSLQVVMISGQGTINTAVEATKLGAYDFLEKPLDSERVLVTLKNALEKNRLEKEKAQLLNNVREQYVMIGKSAPMKRIRNLIAKAAATDSKILIEGGNGTGKELVARAIYLNSQRAGGPFIAVNCAAIPETLIESEFFGYKKGAFTGALTDKMGRFQLADGGTLFLDEIGDMSLMTQSKVLRTLEEGVVDMVGGSEPAQTDVRVIAATNKDLQKEMKEGRFREDLYFRLNVLNIKVPPLSKRKDDIPLLADYFNQYFANEYGIIPKKMTPETMSALMEYNWPGNVRELKNTIEKVIVLVEHQEIRTQDIRSILAEYTQLKKTSMDTLTLKAARQEFEREFIKRKLVACEGNVTKTAKALDIPRTYLHKKMNNLGVQN